MMSFGIICRQKSECDQDAAFRFTWPGKDESFICERHGRRMVEIAQAMGLHIQLIPLTDQDHSGPEGMKSPAEQRK